MQDIADIGFKADTDDLKTAKEDLEKLKPAAEKAERASDKLTDQMNKTNRASDKLANQMQRTNSASLAMTKGFNSVSRALSSMAAAVGTTIAAAFSVKSLFQFTDALAEVSTLVDTSTFKMDLLASSALKQSAAFGGNATGQVKAFYQIISAGASSAAQANDILTASNKLAVGGVTDVATAADGLTSVLNAYGSKVESATSVSDALFVGMRAGKTTIGELSASLGKVAPLAAQTGVGFDELVASVSALTKGGISTNEAITGVRAVLAAVAKPTAEASKLAAKLGLEFNSSALETKGFATFLQDLVKKTGGSTDALSLLFGGVEALVPVMALSGQAGEDFTKILDDMAKKAGETEKAFDKMANSPGFQAGRVWSNLQAEVLGVSGALGGPMTSALKAIADNMHTIVIVMAIFTAGHLAAAIGGVIGQTIAMTSAMGAATIAARALSLAMAFFGGPIGIAVTVLAGAFLLLRDNVSEVQKATEASEQAYMNNISLLNDAKSASEGYTMALRNQIAMQAQVAQANYTLAGQRSIDAYSRARGFENATGFKFAPFEYASEQATSEKKSAFTAAVQLEQQLAKVDANLKSIESSSNGAANGIAGLGGDGKGGGAAKALTELQQIAKDFATLSEPFDQASGAFNAAKSALENGIITNDQYSQSLAKIEAAFMRAGGSAEQWANIVGSSTDTVASKMKDLAEGALTQLGDEFISLAVDGKANFADLAKSIIKDLLRIAWQALVVKPLLGFLGFSSGGAIGSSGVLAAAKGATFFAGGGSFTNSIVDKPTPFTFANGGALGVMGEAGPEAIMPLQRGPDGSLGVQMYGGQGRSQNVSNSVEVNNEYKIEGAISEDKIVSQIKAANEKSADDVKQSLIPWLNQYQRDGTL